MLMVEQRGAPPAQPWTLNREGGRTAGAEDDGRTAEIADGLRRSGWGTAAAGASDDDLDEVLSAVHTPHYLRYLETTSAELPEGEYLVPDNRAAPGVVQDTPLQTGTYQAAWEGARTALTAAALVAQGRQAAYALCRPPGHHAGPDWLGGYCFLNNAAVAVEALARHGRSPGVLDLDFHIGNGTAAILARHSRRPYASIHAATSEHYPWTDDLAGVSADLCFDMTEPPSEQEYVTAVAELVRRLTDGGTDALVLSLGFDTLAGDPHGGWTLSPRVYGLVAAAVAAPGWPICIVQEGGYRRGFLSECAAEFGRGLSGDLTRKRGAHG
ncbi:hypothetical protein [Nonomuraea sp. NPDC003804]|uniref:hypothetical protein n=1 Tax=Nonomuraea sp. NPDC003804 TaxID=3154547 RepID=UPI0033A1FB2C